MLMERARSVLLVVDIQERLLPTMADPDAVVAGTQTLIEAARVLEVPVLVSEQYPKGLGPTVAPIRDKVAADEVLEKLSFGCLGDAGIAARLDALGRDRVILCGIEAHVCVLQTALGALAGGRDACIVADATGSRNPAHVDLALDRLRGAGGQAVNVEMTLFEWMGQAGTADFKTVSALIK